MKFAYIAAALFGLAVASPVALEAPTEDSLAALDAREESNLDFFDARDEDDFLTLEEREENADLLASFDDMFAAIEERYADFEDFEEEEIDDAIEARSVSSVLKALKKVNGDVKNINKKLSKVKGSGPSNKQALAINKVSAKLSQDIGKATGAVKKSKKPGKGGAKKIFKFVKGSLAPSTKKSLKGFAKKASGFKKKGFGDLVRQRLGSLKGQTNGLGKALVSKAPKSLKKSGNKINSSIQKAFSKTLKKY